MTGRAALTAIIFKNVVPWIDPAALAGDNAANFRRMDSGL